MSFFFVVLGFLGIKSNATEECHNHLEMTVESNSIPVYLSTDFENPLCTGCPKCHNNKFINPGLGLEEENLYICTKCGFQFIIKTVHILN